jgi:hypothetical protein
MNSRLDGNWISASIQRARRLSEGRLATQPQLIAERAAAYLDILRDGAAWCASKKVILRLALVLEAFSVGEFELVRGCRLLP